MTEPQACPRCGRRNEAQRISDGCCFTFWLVVAFLPIAVPLFLLGVVHAWRLFLSGVL